MNKNTSYPFLPTCFPRLTECALMLLGKHRKNVRAILEKQLSDYLPFFSVDTDSLWMEICIENRDTMLIVSFDRQGWCDLSLLLLRGPVPQLGDCVRYFHAEGEYDIDKKCWLLADAMVTLDKTGDEVCCRFCKESAL